MPRLEEVSDDDIDNMDMDVAEFDPNLRTPIAPKLVSKVTKSTNYDEPPLFPNINNDVLGDDDIPQLLGSKNDPIPMLVDQDGNKVDAADFPVTTRDEMKNYQLLYPCYFDANRSLNEGRRVPKELAVANPLAKTISDACIRLGLKTILEPDKTHPQDFGNSGRVRVLLKENQTAVNEYVKNKRVLIKKVAVYLQKHQTSLQSVKELKLPNFDPQLQSNEYTPQEVPVVKGMKMNRIVPLHSPLLMGHPQLKSVYDKEPPMAPSVSPSPPVMPKKKILKVRR